MTFSDLNLYAPILKAIEDSGYEIPTPIQFSTVPVVLDGVDLLASAQTGTGKTAAFAWPILDDVSQFDYPTEPLALVLTPTRELAHQVAKSFATYGKYCETGVVSLVGGESIVRQQDELKRRPHVVVATPGRLLDHMERRNVRFTQLRTLVLDEADRMLDMGFIADVMRIARALPRQRQTLFFSATLSPEVETLARDLLHKPERVGIALTFKASDKVAQVLHPVDSPDKRMLMLHLLEQEEMEQVLVFARTRRGAERLATVLRSRRVSVDEIHGDRSQRERNEALEAFKSGRVRVLVATDVASRGLDIQGISHVVNYDMPGTAEEYVHRIGRTGRAGATGHAVSFVSGDDWNLVREIEVAIERKIPRELVSGFYPTQPEPARVGPEDWDGKGVRVVYSAWGSS